MKQTPQGEPTQNANTPLTAAELRFENLVRDATVGIIVLEGHDMVVGVVNAAYARLIGRTTNQLMGYPLFSIIPEAEQVFRPILEKVKQSGEPIYLYEHPYKVFAGQQTVEGFLNLVYQPYRQPDGAITGIMVLCQDVTPLVEARKKIEVAEETTRLAVEAAELGTFDVDLQTNEIVSSHRLNELFGLPAESDREAMIQTIHPDDIAIRKEAYRKGFETGLLKYEIRIIQPNGSLRWIRTKGKILYDVQAVPARLLGVVQDITTERQFAEELSRQVAERTGELEQFLFVSHHDLQEPLRKMMIFSQQVLTDQTNQLSAMSAISLQKVHESAQRMSRALRGVMNLASMSNTEEFGAVDLNEVLALVLTDLELAVAESKASINMEPLPTVTSSSRQMQQLFYNLIGNALKFARAEVAPVINITARKVKAAEAPEIAGVDPNKKYHYLQISDNGIGFDQQHAEKIFKMFHRLHGKQRYSGTGIGLALCKKVVDNHRGSIWATSGFGKGATFHILLPE